MAIRNFQPVARSVFDLKWPPSLHPRRAAFGVIFLLWSISVAIAVEEIYLIRADDPLILCRQDRLRKILLRLATREGVELLLGEGCPEIAGSDSVVWYLVASNVSIRTGDFVRKARVTYDRDSRVVSVEFVGGPVAWGKGERGPKQTPERDLPDSGAGKPQTPKPESPAPGSGVRSPAPESPPATQEQAQGNSQGFAGLARADNKPAPAPLVLVFEPMPPSGGDAKAAGEWKRDDWATAVRARLGAFEIQATVEPRDKGRLAVTLADSSQKAKAVDLLKETGRISFHLLHPDNEIWIKNAAPKAPPPDGYRILCIPSSTVDGRAKPEERLLVRAQPSLKSDIIRRSFPVEDPNKGWVVQVDMTKEGARNFGKLTAAHVRERLAIVMGETVLAAPMILSPITGGSAEISGMGTAEVARGISTLTNLPFPTSLRLVE